MTPQTPVTVLSGGAVGPRALGEAASTGPVRHVLDWFHLAMRIQHVAQCVKGWPDTTADERQNGADLADIVEHIRWRLWHGQVRRALDLVGETLLSLNAMAEMNSATARAASKVAQALGALGTYGAGLSHLIIDCTRQPGGLRRTVLDVTHRRRGAMAFAPSDGIPAADAMVATGCSSDAQGSHIRRQRQLRLRSCRRRTMGSAVRFRNAA